MKTLFKLIFEKRVGAVSKKSKNKISITAYPSMPKKLCLFDSIP